MSTLTSRNNPKIKLIRSLRSRKKRQKSELFLIEGLWHIGEALAAPHIQLEGLYYAADLFSSPFAKTLIERAARAQVPCHAVSADVFETLAEKENPQGMLAVAHPPRYILKELNPQANPWLVALVAPQDPGNLGTILRTIDAVGADGLILIDQSTDPFHPSAVRASMGAVFWKPVVQCAFHEFRAWAAEWNYTIYGTSANEAQAYQEIAGYERPCILLMGSERAGLTQEQRAACRTLIRLPMLGRVTSLNLGVTTGIMLYEMLAKF